MKKIVSIILMTLLFSSCFFDKEEEKLESEENTEVSNNEDVDNEAWEDNTEVWDSDGGIVGDNNWDTSDEEVTTQKEKDDIKEIIWDDVMNEEDENKTDDEIVKEFESELDSLFELLEWDE